jgi:secreted trypsin-like serine protease
MTLLRLLLAGLAVAGLAGPATAGAVTGGRSARASHYKALAYIDGCDASLIAPDRLMTAGHCVVDRTLEQVGTVRFATGETRKAAHVAIARGFALLPDPAHAESSRDDVAIVALDRPVTDIKPFALVGGRVRTGAAVRLVGSGATESPRAAAVSLPRLHEATARTISDGACGDYWRRYAHGHPHYRHAFDGPTMLCTSARRSTICQGDSGGPLLVRAGHAWRVAGVSSWIGDRCATGPSVFADVRAFRGFVTAPSPVWAPARGQQATTLTGDPRVGATLTCTGPTWTPADTAVSYRFVSYRYRGGTRVAQDGPSTTYVVTPADAGRLVLCQAFGTTAGGTLGAPGSAAVRIPGG